MTTALVVAGHGSHISPQTAGIVWQNVDALRMAGVADEITAAFWKESPSFHSVLDTLTASDITVVPLFTAQGYFTRTVIPAEMGLEGSVTRRDGRVLRYARTLSEHPYLAQVVQQRVHDALQVCGARSDQAAVAIIGHSTRRNPDSRKATEAQVDLVRRAGLVAEVVAVYLDDSPGIAEVYDLTSVPYLIAVPCFLALGSHTTIDVPDKLGLAPGQKMGRVRDRVVIYTPPVGIEQALRDVIMELARDAGAPLREPQPGSAWDCFPAAGRDDLIAAVQRAGPLTFGQLLLTPSEVRPVSAGDGEISKLSDPAALRARVREHPFRPLATADNLPVGWRIPITRPDMLHAVVETVYPGAAAHWSAHKHGILTVEPLESTAARQTGMYQALAALDPMKQAEVAAHVCGHCVRHPTWHHGETPAGAIPCPEVCNVWMSAALDESAV